MQYNDLHELFRGSRSSRRYFLSLPVKMQLQLSAHSANIHNAAQLHEAVRLLEAHNRALSISDGTFHEEEPF